MCFDNVHEPKGRTLSEDELKVLMRAKRHVAYILLPYSCYFNMWRVFYTGSEMMVRMKNDLHTTGHVVGIKSYFHRGGNGGLGGAYDGASFYIYRSEIEFLDVSFSIVRFEDDVEYSKPAHAVGDKVDVMYSPNNSSNAMIDRGIFNWGMSGGLAIGGVMVLLVSLNYFRISRNFRGLKYKS